MTAAEASVLLLGTTLRLSAVNRENARLLLWQRAALRVLVDQRRDLDRLHEQLQHERQQHRDLRERLLLATEAA